MADILMVATPSRYRRPYQSPKFIRIHWLTAAQFWQNETNAQRHDAILWQAFHTHGKYMQIARLASHFAVATDRRGRYLASAMIIPVGAKWLLEYLMTDPARQNRGVGSAIINRVTQEARRAGTRWVILNCDPAKNNGQLLKLYTTLGFKPVESA